MTEATRKLCQCGFANKPEATTCMMCGSPFEEDQASGVDEHETDSMTVSDSSKLSAEAPSLIFISQAPVIDSAGVRRENAQVVIPPTGGVIGRAGDFSPEIFSGRISAVHARISYDGTRWSFECLGRNKSYVLRAGSWVEIPRGSTINLIEGDRLRLADMLFSVSVHLAPTKEAGCEQDGSQSASEACEVMAHGGAVGAENNPHVRSEDTSDEVRMEWVVTCPLCGQQYQVESETSRVTRCSVCRDALDKRAIASVSPRWQEYADSLDDASGISSAESNLL